MKDKYEFRFELCKEVFGPNRKFAKGKRVILIKVGFLAEWSQDHFDAKNRSIAICPWPKGLNSLSYREIYLGLFHVASNNRIDED
jgi:hypothetical protein